MERPHTSVILNALWRTFAAHLPRGELVACQSTSEVHMAVTLAPVPLVVVP